MVELTTGQSTGSSVNVTSLPANSVRISILVLGSSLSSFFAVTYLLCVVFDLWFPQLAMNSVWGPLLPGFVWLSWGSFFLGLGEVVFYGWYIAIVFGLFHNLFADRFRWLINTR